jgi:hypothetical protein
MCVFCNVWVCVYVGFVMCGCVVVHACVDCVCMCGFVMCGCVVVRACVGCVCMCGFVMCGCVYMWGL